MINPHGGKLVNRVLSIKETLMYLKDAKKIPHLSVDQDTLLDLENIAVGTYSPLKGFMNKDDFKSVVIRKRLSNGLAWTIPIMLPLNKAGGKKVSSGSSALLCNEKGAPIGLIKIEDIYSIDADKAVKHIFGTMSKEHPGVHKFYQMGDMFAGGEVWLIQKNKYPYHNFNLEPKETRELIAKRKWQTVAGFQTRNIPHRAHEFLQKIGLSLVDGILIHPIIGWKKRGDFKSGIIPISD